MNTANKLPTSLRAFAELRASESKTNDSVQPLGRPRVFSVNPLDIQVFVERNIRPLCRETVESYKKVYLRGEAFPPVDVSIEQGNIVLRHGYHRTIAAQELVRENVDMAHLQVELREFKGNACDSIVLMLNSQNSLQVDPVSRAEAYRALLTQGLTISKIAERLDRTPEHVNQQMVLVEAEEGVKQAIRSGRISATAVIELLRAEKQGGENHSVAISAMLVNAQAAGKEKATLKHRRPANSGKPAKTISLKTVRSALSSLSGITSSLRDSLQHVSNDQLIELKLPADKVTELLALLEANSAKGTDPEQDLTSPEPVS